MGELKSERAPARAFAGNPLVRFLTKNWVHSTYRKIRLLSEDSIPATGPVIFILGGPPNLLHAAAVSGALKRPTHFVLPEDSCTSAWHRWIAAKLGVILYESGPSGQEAARAAASRVLAGGEAVAVFAQPETVRSQSLSSSCVAAAQLVMDAGSGRAGCGNAKLVALHVLSSNGASSPGELLVAVSEPLSAARFLGGASAEASLRTLAGEVENRLSSNPYRLEERDVHYFLADLDKILRADLAEDWSGRPNWKQTTEGFEISRFIIEWAEQLNTLDPAKLIGLRIELEDYRERLRRSSLTQAELDLAGEWLKSGASRARYWIEAILEAPVALYGLINHVIPFALFAPGSLISRLVKKDSGHAWLLRVLVLLGSYFLQVSLCANWWGRAAAGYYALTLPISGFVLWRVCQLYKTRLRLLFLARGLPGRIEQTRQLRKRFIVRLDLARDEYAEAIRSSG